MSTTRTRLAVLLLILGGMSTSVLALSATDADNLAANLLGRIGKSRGLVALPVAGDGQLVRAFAQGSDMMVHAMCADTQGVRTALQVVEPTGHAGTRVVVEKGVVSRIPLATDYADMVVITNVTDAALQSIPITEIMRTLIPTGTALVGRATSEGAGLSTSALQTWTGSRAGTSVVTDAQGTWAVIVKQKKAKADEWTHNLHDAGNTWYSADSVFKWPPLQQWRQKPYVGQIRLGNTVSGGGRVYSVLNEGHGGLAVLRAYRIHNGARLWKKVVGSYASWQPDTKGSMMVAADSGLFVINRNKVDVLSGETGAVVRSIVFDSDTRTQVVWIGIVNGTLYALGGDSANNKTGLGELHADALWYGTAIKAFNATNGAQVWTHAEPGVIESRRIGVSGGRVVLIARATRIAALNASTGAQLWENRDASVVAMMAGEASGGSNDNGVSGLICSPTVTASNLPTDANVVVLSAVDGALLWSSTLESFPYNRPKLLMDDGTLVTSATDVARRAYNVVTNQPVTKYQNLNWSTCGTYAASPNMLLAQHQVYDRLTDQQIANFSSIKGSCGTPMFVSDGLSLQPRNTDCECPRIRALYVECPADTFTFNRQAVQSERLEAGPANANLTAQVVTDSLDWQTHRANLSRSASVSVDVPAAPNLVFRAQRAFAYDVSIATCVDTFDAMNTPPVTAGTLAWWGGSDGYVRCYDMQSGSERWSYATAGRIYATPTVAGGCVYVGSMDGYAYCIEAHTGRLVWRFRGAPVERRINFYGQLASQWPIITGVVVNAGNAYFAAGYDENYGTHVYALNARTGAIVWQHNSSATLRDKANSNGFAPNGFMTVSKNKLLIRSTNGRPAVFDLTTGAFEPLQAVFASADNRGCPSVRGKEIGVVLGRAVIQGSAYPWADHSERGRNLGDRTLNQIANLGIDANGLPVYPQVNVLMACVRAPAWDASDFVTSSWGTTRLEKWNTSRMLDTCDALRAVFPASSFANWQTMNIGSDWHNVTWGKTNPTPLATSWILPNAEINAIALARNAIVVTQAKNTAAPQANWTWWLSILSRSSPTVTWEVQLPGIPLQDGLSIARDGTILVAFKNGDVYGYGSGTPVSVAAQAIPMAQPDPSSRTQWDGWVVLPAPGGGNDGVRASSVAGTEKHITETVDTRTVIQMAQTIGLRPLSTLSVRLADGTVAPMHAVTHEDPQGIRYREASMTWDASREVVDVKGVVASSSAKGCAPAGAVDRDLRTRWTASGSGRQSITVDLGAATELSATSVVWYSARAAATPFHIEVSSDGSSFTVVDEGMLSGRGTQTVLRTFVPSVARYVRVWVTVAPGAPAPSIHEVGAHALQDVASARGR